VLQLWEQRAVKLCVATHKFRLKDGSSADLCPIDFGAQGTLPDSYDPMHRFETFGAARAGGAAGDTDRSYCSGRPVPVCEQDQFHLLRDPHV
jgi:hypothetical protein